MHLHRLLALAGFLLLAPLAGCSGDVPDEECIPECGAQVCGREPKCGTRCGSCPIGLACASDGLSCTSPPPLGAACQGDDSCGADRVCLLPTEGAPGGYCTTVCSDESPCGDGAICLPGPRGEGVCHVTCEPGMPDQCRVAEGYLCSDDGFCPTCVPSCTGRTCGADGCGGSCGVCPADDRHLACSAGACTTVFTSTAELPRARWEIGAGVLGGYVYLVGGQEVKEEARTGAQFGNAVNWVERYDPETKKTEQLDSLALEKPLAEPHVLVAKAEEESQEKLYVIGGVVRTREQVTDPKTKETSLVTTIEPSEQVFALESGEGLAPAWVEKMRLPEASMGSAAVALNGALYVFSGEIDSGLSTRGFRYVLPMDPGRSWNEVSSDRTPRRLMTAATDGRYIWLFGGWDGGKDLKLIERYDPEKNEWTTVGELPYAVSGATAITVDGRIFLFGGDGASLVPLVEFDPVREVALEIGIAYDRLLAQSPVQTRVGVLLFGGMRKFGGMPTATSEVFRFEVPRR